jgi:hypothetical protein
MQLRIAGMQTPAAISIAALKLNILGTGMTYMFFAEPPRIGENGPSSSEHVNPQKVWP